MSDMVEKVARAIYSAYVGPEPLSDWERISARDHEMHRKLARAAIEAMREPNEAMVSAGMAEEGTDLASEYRAMIDAALSTKGEG